MKYETFNYCFPGRPRKAIAPAFLNFHEKRGWVGQYKKNGTCNVLFVSPDKEVTAMTRHNDTHKLWTPTEASTGLLRTVPGNGWWVFNAELLHSKSQAGPTDTNYLFDVQVADGEVLLDKTFAERIKIMEDLFLKEDSVEEYSHYVVGERVWLAKTITEGFKDKWDEADRVAKTLDTSPTDEGLVLKNPKAVLKPPFSADSNAAWQVKCRVAHTNYAF